MVGKKVWFKDLNDKNQKGIVLDKYYSDGFSFYAIQVDDNMVNHVKCYKVFQVCI